MNSPILRHLGVIAIMVLAWPILADANAPGGHFVVTAGSAPEYGTVYDSKSKLTWQQTAPSATYTWTGAKNYCKSAAVSQTLGGEGWRLPTLKELLSIVDLSQTAGPMIDRSAFPSTPSGVFWSSSANASSPSLAWYVSFSIGDTNYIDVALYRSVRCVR